MAKAPKGILGPFLGKLGPVIGSSWKGIPYVKIAPDPDKPRLFTEAQIASQQKFKFAGDLTDILQPFMDVGFENEAVRKTAKNAAFSYIYHNAVLGVYPNLEMDYSKIMISRGDLPGLSDPTVALLGTNTLKLEWQVLELPLSAFDDQLLFAIYCPALQRADGIIGGSIRRDGQCQYTFDTRFEGHALELYARFSSRTRKKISNSQYLGKIQS